MLKEKKCRHCSKHFTYDNDITTLGHTELINFNEQLKGEEEYARGFCPRCDDPQYLIGYSYTKVAIFHFFRYYLKQSGIAVEHIDAEEIVEMMKHFPRTYSTYTSNGTFRTITLFPGVMFPGQHGEFQLGIAEATNPLDLGHRRVWYEREVTCIRCNTTARTSVNKTLVFYLGLREKLCRKCDAPKYLKEGRERALKNGKVFKKNLTGLNRNGSEKKEYSDRALAKALNVSRMDFRRNHITKAVPPLPIGTRNKTMEILAAYWDEDPKRYSPMYLIRCVECQEQFRVVQKNFYQVQHYCTKLGRMV